MTWDDASLPTGHIKRHGEKWSKAETEQAKRLKEKGWSYGEIATFMYRTESAVETRLTRENLPLDTIGSDRIEWRLKCIKANDAYVAAMRKHHPLRETLLDGETPVHPQARRRSGPYTVGPNGAARHG